NGEIKLVRAGRTEIRIEGLAVTSRSVATDAGEVRLRQRLRNGRERSRHTVHADAERRRGTGAAGSQALVAAHCVGGVDGANAGNRLAWADAQQRHQHKVHAVQTTVDSVVTTADHCLATP